MQTSEKYPSSRVALHWLTLLLLIAVYTVIDLREYFPKGSVTREGLKTWHFMLGLSVLVLVVVRLLLRWMRPGPALLQGPAWQTWLASGHRSP